MANRLTQLQDFAMEERAAVRITRDAGEIKQWYVEIKPDEDRTGYGLAVDLSEAIREALVEIGLASSPA